MKVDDKFYTFKELEDSVKRYSQETLQCFVRRDTTTLDSWNSKQKKQFVIDEKIKADIIYQKVIFKCIHHKKENTETKGNADRLACAYNGKDCKVAINVIEPVVLKIFHKFSVAYFKCYWQRGTNFLQVTSMSQEHSHPLYEETFKLYAPNRKLTEEQEKEVIVFLCIVFIF